MGLLSTLTGGRSTKTTTSTTNVTDKTNAVSIGGDSSAPVYSLTDSTGNNFTVSDMGAIAAGRSIADNSFNFAESALDKASESFSRAQSGLLTAQESNRNAYDQSLAFVSKSQTPADEKTRQQFVYLALGLLLIVGAVVVAVKS